MLRMLNRMLVLSLTMLAVEVAALVAAEVATIALVVAQEATVVPGTAGWAVMAAVASQLA